jgi:hypothetical protein
MAQRRVAKRDGISQAEDEDDVVSEDQLELAARLASGEYNADTTEVDEETAKEVLHATKKSCKTRWNQLGRR